MTFHKFITAFLISVMIAASGWAQVRIPTDTTTQAEEDTVKYGPTTTRYFFQRDLQYNRLTEQTIDTTQIGVHNFSIVETPGNGLQTLGILGMATRPIYPTLPAITGITSGFTAFDGYMTDPEDVRYYNTQSPYILMNPTFGGQGRDVGEVIFSRNITPRWNFAINYRWYQIEQQRGVSGQDKIVESSYINFSTSYQTKNEKYQVLGTFARLGHQVDEYGGVPGIVGGEDGISEFFRGRNSDIFLEDFRGKEIRFNYHLYHQYKINNLLQVYHILDRRHQDNYFTNPLDATDLSYFRRILLDSAQTNDAVRYELWSNEVGVKGNLENLFYSLHARFRRPSITYNNDTVPTIPTFGTNAVRDTATTELYAGFDLRYDFGKKTYLQGGVDYLSAKSYRLEAEFNNPILKAKLVRARVLPTFLSQQFVGNHNYWKNDFDPVATDQLSGSIEYPFPNLYVRPFVTVTNVTRPIYYRQDTVSARDTGLPNSWQAFPEQDPGSAQILSPGVEVNLNFLKKMHFQNEVTYTTVTGTARNRFFIPEWLWHTRLYYENTFINGKVTIQVGLDAQLLSSYVGHYYDVATRQFYLPTTQNADGGESVSDNFEIPIPLNSYPAFLVADAFLTIKVRTAQIYFKIPYINQDLGTDGYFAAPYYPGQERVIGDIGIKWLFFD